MVKRRLSVAQREALERNRARSSCFQKGQDPSELNAEERVKRNRVLDNVR